MILAGNKTKIWQLNTWLLPKLQNSDRGYWALCWRASYHGWSSTTFHSCCDGYGPTVTIVHVHGTYVFGGYNDNSWHCMSLFDFIVTTSVLNSIMEKSNLFKFLKKSLPMFTRSLVKTALRFRGCLAKD